MDALIQRPQGPTFSILNFPKKIWWKLKSNSFQQKKNFEKFWWKLKEYTPYPCQGEQVVHHSGLRGLKARAEILEKISLSFWKIWRHQKEILKLTVL